MNSGMLWFDNDQKTELPDKVTKAAAYYKKKYGRTPTICFVHPSMVNKKSTKSKLVSIKTSEVILPNHLWIGVDDK